ncbi:MAG: alpha/beta hydrolase [Mycobacterium sp.]|uniref:alpha/beta hydrolase n=1 Tax=Mycobacterium sp. TaxID=1785 RepID=UPI003BB7A792
MARLEMQNLRTSVDGYAVSATLHLAGTPHPGSPLLVALHGGTFTSEYFCIAGSRTGSFVDIATRNGFSVLRMDRPGYGASDLLPEDDNTFVRQAELLDSAIAGMLDDCAADTVVLVGHSIGGIVALEIAARQPHWRLTGVAISGTGAAIPAGGAAEQLGALPFSGVVDLPVEEREQLWYGPASSVSAAAIVSARSSFAPAPMIELKSAPKWAAQRLDETALAITVPVHHTLAEFDALWDASPGARDLFLAKFSPTLRVHSEIMAGVGHCIDHHLLGAAMHYNQLAFAHQCMLAQMASSNPF